MAYDNNDWIKAVTKLIRMTSKEEIKWNLTQEYENDPWTEVDRAFEAKLDGFRYVIKEIRRKRFTDETEFYWWNGFSFEIYKVQAFDHDYRVATAPGLDVVESLFSVIENTFAYQEGALAALLKSDD